MDNISLEMTFTLNGFDDLSNNKYMYFAFALIWNILINCFNGTLILTIALKEHLHNPMYIFLCNLFINEICGAASFYPKFMAYLLEDTKVHVVSYAVCFFQIFVMTVYILNELTILALMSYDRYVAILLPLQYNKIMKPSKVCSLLAIAWSFPVIIVILLLLQFVNNPLCGTHIDKIYCQIFEVLKLLCFNNNVFKVYGVLLLTLFAPLFSFIIYSYARILILCKKSSYIVRQKALSTCMPHLITLSFYFVTLLFECIQNQLNYKHFPTVIQILLSLEIIIFPPLLNPVIYGLALPNIRKMAIPGFGRKKIIL